MVVALDEDADLPDIAIGIDITRTCLKSSSIRAERLGAYEVIDVKGDAVRREAQDGLP
jgi:phage-related baseplate assembly protein